MTNSATFVDSVLAGDRTLDAIDDFIDQWHDGDSDLEIWQFLGMTREEYGSWVINPAALPEIINSRRLNRPFVAPGPPLRADSAARS